MTKDECEEIAKHLETVGIFRRCRLCSQVSARIRATANHDELVSACKTFIAASDTDDAMHEHQAKNGLRKALAAEPKETPL